MVLYLSKDKLVLKCTYEERTFAKSVTGRWDGKLRAWTFSPSILVFNTITDEANKLGFKLEVCKKTEAFFLKQQSSRNEFRATNNFKTPPYEYQRHTTNFIIGIKKGLILAEVGAGKSKVTIDAVTVLHEQGTVKKVLVVSPSSVMHNFKNEVLKHSHYDCTVIEGSVKKRKDLITDSQTVFDVVNYEMLGKLHDEIVTKAYDMIVFDEIHYCKTRTSNRSKDAYQIAKGIPLRVGLSGTIFSNNYEDIFMPYKIIDESIFGPHYTKFKNRYFVIENWLGFDQITGYKNEAEVKRLMSLNSIQIKIRDVIDSLPPEQEIVKSIQLTPRAKKYYKDLKNDMLIEHERGDIIASNILTRLLRLSQITSGFIQDKDNAIIDDISTEKLDMLKNTLEQIESKTVIFCRFRHSIDRVVKLCESMGLSYYVYDGRTKEKDLYLKFNKDDTRIWISQVQKSVGYSLDAAQYCIFYEMDYSRVNHIQAKGRILRASGSPHKCIFYIYFIVEKTVDEAVFAALKEKDFKSEQALELIKGVNQ